MLQKFSMEQGYVNVLIREALFMRLREQRYVLYRMEIYVSLFNAFNHGGSSWN